MDERKENVKNLRNQEIAVLPNFFIENRNKSGSSPSSVKEMFLRAPDRL